MSHFKLQATARGRDLFDAAMKMAFSKENRGSEAVAYLVRDNQLLLFWHCQEGCTKLPYAMNAKQATEFAWGWLEQAEREPAPEFFDGSTDKGWELACGDHILGSWYTIATIKPVTMLYGK